MSPLAVTNAPGMLLGDDLGGAPLVLGVEVGEEEADRDRVDARSAAAARRGPRTSSSSSGSSTSPAGGPIRSLTTMTVAALDERPGLPGDVLHDRVVLRALVAADVDDVAEARVVIIPVARRGARAPRSSRPSSRGRPRRCRPARPRQGAELHEPGDQRPRRVLGRRAYLVDVHRPRLGVVQHEVGERAADVDADNPHPTAILFGCICAGQSSAVASRGSRCWTGSSSTPSGLRWTRWVSSADAADRAWTRTSRLSPVRRARPARTRVCRTRAPSDR